MGQGCGDQHPAGHWSLIPVVGMDYFYITTGGIKKRNELEQTLTAEDEAELGAWLASLPRLLVQSGVEEEERLLLNTTLTFSQRKNVHLKSALTEESKTVQGEATYLLIIILRMHSY